MEIDFGRTATDYGSFRAGFPEALFDRLAGHRIGAPGQRLLDLGTGTGALARGFARRGCRVTGLDRSAELIAEAARLDHEAGVEVRYVIGEAETTGLPDAAFDAVTAGQCWHWFDRKRAAREVRRLLVPGGRLAICHFDWLPLPGNVVDITEKLIKAHNPDWGFDGMTGIHADEPGDVAMAGFGDIETFSFDVAVPYTHEAWRGRIRASAGVGASLDPDAVARFDSTHAAFLKTRFRDDPLSVPHRCFAVVCRAP
ncbi:MAG: class I SAM-dependent methyltransferase [Alphaproteobacteria bacterium]